MDKEEYISAEVQENQSTRNKSSWEQDSNEYMEKGVQGDRSTKK
jgi:hypothetical protein